MKVMEIDRDKATIVFTQAELVILNNALNEVCNGIDVPEFATRLGAELSEVRQLLHEVNHLLDHHLFRPDSLP